MSSRDMEYDQAQRELIDELLKARGRQRASRREELTGGESHAATEGYD